MTGSVKYRGAVNHTCNLCKKPKQHTTLDGVDKLYLSSKGRGFVLTMSVVRYMILTMEVTGCG